MPKRGKRRPAIVAYAVENLPPVDTAMHARVRESMTKVDEILVAPRDASTFEVDAGQVFRITSVEGPQVGDLNVWNRHDLTERFFSGKTHQLHGTHVDAGDRLWSSIPHMRPLATIIHDTLDWYGYDDDGGGVHDVIGTRCDPYTKRDSERRRLSPLLPLEPQQGAVELHRATDCRDRTVCARRG